jgi:hypothetical protein
MRGIELSIGKPSAHTQPNAYLKLVAIGIGSGIGSGAGRPGRW